jgi:two-component system C4-dicarboxylate transport sensor histidine kinase DctB
MPIRTPSRWPLLALLAIATALAGLALWQTAYWARHVALGDLATRSAQTLDLVVENLRGELAKYSVQPDVLSNHPTVVRGLSRPADPAAIAELNDELARINTATGALDTYVMRGDGTTIAASNWQTAKSFVGNNFSYRPYFQDAMQGRSGRYYALGTTSGERGYFFSRPVRDGDAILGVVVVKMDVSRLEAGWPSGDNEILVADEEGIVFLSSRPEWRLRATAPLSADARKGLQATRRYPDGALAPLAVTLSSEGDHEFIDIAPAASARSAPRRYLRLASVMPDAGWSVMMLADTRVVPRQVNTALTVVGLLLASLVFAAANIYQRRRRLADRLAFQDAARVDLEQKVLARTGELEAANASLRIEIAERERAENELRRAQSDLIQASKLAALGQMAAGLSHELNQPLAAIRAYAGNARAFLTRSEPGKVDANLASIGELTDRMARIIQNLRTYARKEPIATRPTLLAPAIRDALALLEPRIAAAGAEVTTELPEEPLLVNGGEVRLQQVLVNLISNAVDALSGRAEKKIRIAARIDGNAIALSVADSGPGIAAEDLPRVFDPFFSTKKVGDGMGLGLSITYGIVQQFGGEISVANADEGGAVFTVRLRRAEAPLEIAS